MALKIIELELSENEFEIVTHIAEKTQLSMAELFILAVLALEAPMGTDVRNHLNHDPL